MFIDLERYEVERGYKAVHNLLKGQELAVHLGRYGEQVSVPLLVAATVGMVGGFALLNQGLYETIGNSWFKVEGGEGGPIYADFLAYAFINLLGIVDVLDLAQTHHYLRTAYVHQAQWPASMLLAGFRMFFVLVMLQQIFGSLRKGKLLAETITDLWSPHEPIHERARNALPQYGSLAIEPLLVSLRSVPTLTKEQRDQLPLILATIGPSTIPALVRRLHDAHAHVRAISAAALGRLHALDTVPMLVTLASDTSDMVRQSLVEALGILASSGTRLSRKQQLPSGPHGSGEPWRGRGLRIHGRRWLFGWVKRGRQAPVADLIALIVSTLEAAMNDTSAAVRTQAALALGSIGPRAGTVAPGLIALLKDGDETVRCQAAEALGQVSVSMPAEAVEPRSVAALVELLQDASAPVKAAAAQALAVLKTSSASAVPSLVPLLQDRE